MNDEDYEQAVNSFYEELYRFAYSLAGNADDACELTQEAFAKLLTKGSQVRDRSKIKSWLHHALPHLPWLETPGYPSPAS
jgi:DNA-directed RNA polymerase specialized sigma24 family protein